MSSALRHRVGAWDAAALVCLGALVLINLPALADAVAPAVGQWLWVMTAVLAAARITTRARGPQRGAWALLAAGLLIWSTGFVWYAAFVLPDPAAPTTIVDLLWVGGYGPLVAAVLLLVRHNLASSDTQVWLDGLIAGLGAAAVGSAVMFDVGGLADGPMLVAVVYPVLDLFLLGVAAGGYVVTSGCVRRTWRWLIAGLLVLTVTDTAFLTGLADRHEHLAAIVQIGWPLAFWIFAQAAPPGLSATRVATTGLRAVPAVPLLCAAIALAVLVVDRVAHVSAVPAVCAIVTLALSLARTASALRANVRLQDTADQAMTDELTGLSNRRRLLRDLDHVAGRADRAAMLVLFDLDGFKAYNDAYGHPAGDGLLAALGQRLRRSVAGQGDAYRLGGDEFCILVGSDDVDHQLVLDRALEALRQEGDGFSIGASYGRVAVPGEAGTSSEALQLADTRMYAYKDAGRASTRRQSRDLLLQILHEQQPDLEEHSGDVGELVVAVGRRLGMDAEALDRSRHAAELHDVGKVAIPAAILRKPGPLDDDEWALMRRHTIIGERILSSVPALVPVGHIVRATHERWDGDGYPDGLRGEEIPLGARVIAVCDSFHAITTDRPYRAGRPPEEALEELRRCAGTQFDPAVVEAFATELATGALDGAERDGDADGATGAVARRVAPAGAIAQTAAGELAQLAKLRGLLHATELARGGADIAEVLDAIARTIASSLGFRVVSINLFRPEWDEFVCTAVHGDDSVRDQLLGKHEPADSWRPLLDEQFARGGAYFVPAGAVDFDDHDAATYYVPDIAPSDDPGAWQADDLLLVPLRGQHGDVLGMVSVDEPVWGRRPSDAEVEVLVAVADHAALALRSARSASIGRAARAAGHRAAALGRELAAVAGEEQVAAAVRTCVREALGYETVAVELVTNALDAHMLDELLAGVDADGGVAVLAGEAAWKARAWRGVAGSSRNGRGPQAWNDHMVVSVVRGAADELLAVVWCDDPADRLLPHQSTLRVLRQIAAQAVVPLAWGRRTPAPAVTSKR